jgi:hypothetical protein
VFCHRNAYQSLNPVFRVIRQMSVSGLLDRMLPRDIQAFLTALPDFEHDLALELICAWVNEPAAIRLVIAHRPSSRRYTGEDLLVSLQQVCGP